MFDLAQESVAAALASGARYADARVVISKSQSIAVLNSEPQSIDQGEHAGIGVRALIGSSWGFYATSDLTMAAARDAGAKSAAIARASASVPGAAMPLADVAVVEAFYETPYEEDPFEIAISDKVDSLVAVTKTMQEVEGIGLASGNMSFWDTNKWFASSQGHRIHQHLMESGGGFDATAVGETETQRRSYPQSFGQYETGGYETIRKWDYLGNAGRVAEEAAALLAAPQLDEAETSLILEGSQLALQIHESVGHAIELDRILEAADREAEKIG